MNVFGNQEIINQENQEKSLGDIISRITEQTEDIY